MDLRTFCCWKSTINVGYKILKSMLPQVASLRMFHLEEVLHVLQVCYEPVNFFVVDNPKLHKLASNYIL
jgi:hypothetical protein